MDASTKGYTQEEKNTTHEYLFNRILKCKKCGSNLICQPAWKKLRNSNERVLHKYYYCKTCKQRINETTLVKQFIHTYPFHKLLKVDKDVIHQLKKVNNRIRKRISYINTDYDNGIISDEMYRKAIEEALSKIKHNNAEIKEIEKIKLKSLIENHTKKKERLY